MPETREKSPIKSTSSPLASWNVVGCVGFSLSLVGVIGLFLVGPFGPVSATVGMNMTFLCVPGLVASIVGLIRTPRRLAGWGIVLGIFGSLYLPTFYLSIFLSRY